jgi:hypothetical protein
VLPWDKCCTRLCRGALADAEELVHLMTQAFGLHPDFGLTGAGNHKY